VIVLGQRKRAVFARDLGLSGDRVLGDLESAKRDNYSADTLLSLPTWYQLDPDAIRAVLGDLYPHSEIMGRVADVTVTSARTDKSERLADLEDDFAALTALVAKIQREITDLQSPE
jgi:hypothetical protein